MAIRKESNYSFSFSHEWTRECNGDALICTVREKARKGEQLRRRFSFVLVNVYLAPAFGAETNRSQREGAKVRWELALEKNNGIVAGDFNAHSKRWDAALDREGRDVWARWMEDLIDTYDLQITNDGEHTFFRDNSEYSAAINLTLSGSDVIISDWEVVRDDAAVTGSDHEVIRWKAGGRHEDPRPGRNEEEGSTAWE